MSIKESAAKTILEATKTTTKTQCDKTNCQSQLLNQLLLALLGGLGSNPLALLQNNLLGGILGGNNCGLDASGLLGLLLGNQLQQLQLPQCELPLQHTQQLQVQQYQELPVQQYQEIPVQQYQQLPVQQLDFQQLQLPLQQLDFQQLQLPLQQLQQLPLQQLDLQQLQLPQCELPLQQLHQLPVGLDQSLLGNISPLALQQSIHLDAGALNGLNLQGLNIC